MRKITVKNKAGKELVLGYEPPFILKRLEFERDANIYNTKSVNQDGANYEGNTLDVGVATLHFAILSNSKEEARRNSRTFNQVFNPKLDELEIKEDGRKIIAVPSEVPYLVENEPLITEGVVSLIAHDPYYKDITGTTSEIALWRPTFEFPLELAAKGIEMGYKEPSLIVNVFNGGDVETGMRIVFRASATVVRPSLFNVNTREFFQIEGTLRQGDRLEVTTGYQNKRVEIIRGEIRETYYEWDYKSTFMQLQQGDNFLRYDADEGLDNLSVDIHFTQKYLGV